MIEPRHEVAGLNHIAHSLSRNLFPRTLRVKTPNSYEQN
jgi:hypothetical protein